MSSAEAELYGIVDGSARGIFTKHLYQEMGKEISVQVNTDSSAAMAACSRSGVGKMRHIQLRWLWVQDAVRDKTIVLKKVKGTDNVSDMGTKALDGPTHQRLLAKLPLRQPTCRRLVGLAAVATAATPTEAASAGATQVAKWVGDDIEIYVEKAATYDWFWLLVQTVVLGAALVCCFFYECQITPRRRFRTVGVQTVVAATTTVEKSVQSPVTYTAIRGCMHPRFLPLPEHSHG